MADINGLLSLLAQYGAQKRSQQMQGAQALGQGISNYGQGMGQFAQQADRQKFAALEQERQNIHQGGQNVLDREQRTSEGSKDRASSLYTNLMRTRASLFAENPSHPGIAAIDKHLANLSVPAGFGDYKPITTPDPATAALERMGAAPTQANATTPQGGAAGNVMAKPAPRPDPVVMDHTPSEEKMFNEARRLLSSRAVNDPTAPVKNAREKFFKTIREVALAKPGLTDKEVLDFAYETASTGPAFQDLIRGSAKSGRYPTRLRRDERGSIYDQSGKKLVDADATSAGDLTGILGGEGSGDYSGQLKKLEKQLGGKIDFKDGPTTRDGGDLRKRTQAYMDAQPNPVERFMRDKLSGMVGIPQKKKIPPTIPVYIEKSNHPLERVNGFQREIAARFLRELRGP